MHRIEQERAKQTGYCYNQIGKGGIAKRRLSKHARLEHFEAALSHCDAVQQVQRASQEAHEHRWRQPGAAL